MKFHARLSFFAPALGAILFALAVSAPGAQASFGVESFFAANCNAEHEGCKKPANMPPKNSKGRRRRLHAGGRPSAVRGHGLHAQNRRNRTDAPGQRAPKATEESSHRRGPGRSRRIPKLCRSVRWKIHLDARRTRKRSLPAAQMCRNRQRKHCDRGKHLTTVIEIPPENRSKAICRRHARRARSTTWSSLKASRPTSVSRSKKLPGLRVVAHTFIKGHVEWASDYHDYFEIKNIHARR